MKITEEKIIRAFSHPDAFLGVIYLFEEGRKKPREYTCEVYGPKDPVKLLNVVGQNYKDTKFGLYKSEPKNGIKPTAEVDVQTKVWDLFDKVKKNFTMEYHMLKKHSAIYGMRIDAMMNKWKEENKANKYPSPQELASFIRQKDSNLFKQLESEFYSIFSFSCCIKKIS